jgi:hypothetical protein
MDSNWFRNVACLLTEQIKPSRIPPTETGSTRDADQIGFSALMSFGTQSYQEIVVNAINSSGAVST